MKLAEYWQTYFFTNDLMIIRCMSLVWILQMVVKNMVLYLPTCVWIPNYCWLWLTLYNIPWTLLWRKIQKRPIHVYTIDLYHIYSDWWLQTVKQYGDDMKIAPWKIVWETRCEKIWYLVQSNDQITDAINHK